MMQTIDLQIEKGIFDPGCGALFTPTDFVDFGGRDAVDKVLPWLAASDALRRLAWGLYDYPKEPSPLDQAEACHADGALMQARRAVIPQPKASPWVYRYHDFMRPEGPR